MTVESKAVRNYEKRLRDAGGCTLSLCINPDANAALKRLCEVSGLSRTQVINRLIQHGYLFGNLSAPVRSESMPQIVE
jgi:peroxiredoxin